MRRKSWWLSAVIVVIICFFFYWRYQSRNYKISLYEASKKDETVDHIRVGTYNIKLLDKGNGMDQFVQEMKELQPDIICLQEVDQHTFRTGNIEMVKEMAEAAGYSYYYFYQTMWIIKGYYGIGILSKYPIIEVSSTQLPNYMLNEPRVLASAMIDLNGKPLSIYHTHLSFKEREVRKKQIDYISKEIQHKENTIFMGDFNTFTATDFFDIEGMTAIQRAYDPFITFQDFGFPDNIYFSNDMKLEYAASAPITFSDHHLLYCDLSLK